MRVLRQQRLFLRMIDHQTMDRSQRVRQEVGRSERRHKRRKIELMHKFRMVVTRIKRLCYVRSFVNNVDLMTRDLDEELNLD